jgi:hypothetical protein
MSLRQASYLLSEVIIPFPKIFFIQIVSARKAEKKSPVELKKSTGQR